MGFSRWALFMATAVAAVQAIKLNSKDRRQHWSDLAEQMLARAAKRAPSQTTQDLLRTFEICGACDTFDRYGEEYDGGYLMCMDAYVGDRPAAVKAAYSMGVEHHDKWSNDVSTRMSIPVYQFDCTVDRAPEVCHNCHFFDKCIKSSDGHEDNFPYQSWSMREVLANTGHADAADRTLLMKMDIESSEWAIYESESQNLLRKFEQIIVEFHNLGNVHRHGQYLKAMRSILAAGFKVAHIHGNNNAEMYSVGGFQVPRVIEVTFTSGPSRPVCKKQQEYFSGLDHENRRQVAELPMASVP